MFLTLALQKMSQIVTPRQKCRIETQPTRVKRFDKRRVAGRSGLSNHVKNCHALAGQILCFLDLMQFTSKYSKM